MIAFERRLQKAYDWINVDCSRFPAPRCRVSSPVIQQLVASWSLDPDHMTQVGGWVLVCVHNRW